jgi:hypothetical protein
MRFEETTMLKSLLVMGMVFAAPCFAKTLLDCSLEGADVSSVTVFEEDGRIKLKEVDIDRRQLHEREVSEQEWASKKIDLFTLDPKTISTLTFDRDAKEWWLDHRGQGDNHFGFMPCSF